MAAIRTAPRLLALGLCAALLAPASSAQTEPGAAMADALAGAGAARPLLRCAALFRALRLHPVSTDATVAGAAVRETDLATTAALVWQDERASADTQAAFDAIVPMIGAASRVYRARMSRNVDASGTPFDDTLGEDLIFCDALHAGLASGRD
ncbi:MAG: hypothetical protein ACOCY0_02520 [Roseicyclus sp.]